MWILETGVDIIEGEVYIWIFHEFVCLTCIFILMFNKHLLSTFYLCSILSNIWEYLRLGWPKKHHFANIHSARPVCGYIYWDELLRKILGHFDQDLTQRRPFQLGTEAKIIKILKTAKTTLKWPRIKKFCLKDTPKYGDFRGCLLNKKFWLEVFKCPKTPF